MGAGAAPAGGLAAGRPTAGRGAASPDGRRGVRRRARGGGPGGPHRAHRPERDRLARHWGVRGARREGHPRAAPGRAGRRLPGAHQRTHRRHQRTRHLAASSEGAPLLRCRGEPNLRGQPLWRRHLHRRGLRPARGPPFPRHPAWWGGGPAVCARRDHRRGVGAHRTRQPSALRRAGGAAAGPVGARRAGAWPGRSQRAHGLLGAGGGAAGRAGGTRGPAYRPRAHQHRRADQRRLAARRVPDPGPHRGGGRAAGPAGPAAQRVLGLVPRAGSRGAAQTRQELGVGQRVHLRRGGGGHGQPLHLLRVRPHGHARPRRVELDRLPPGRDAPRAGSPG